MIRYPPVTHVIFDMDGTLVDTEGIMHTIFSDIVTKTYGKAYTSTIPNKTAGHTMLDTAEIIVHECELPCDVYEFMSKVSEQETECLLKCVLKPGVDRLVKHLYKNDIPMCIATSSSMNSVDIKLRNHRNLTMLLHHITCGTDNPEVKAGKPAPDVFLVAASKFDERPPPRKCLVFEDSYTGVLAARRAGMQVIMIPDPNLPEDDTFIATLVLNSMNYFQPELFGLPPFQCRM